MAVENEGQESAQTVDTNSQAFKDAVAAQTQALKQQNDQLNAEYGKAKAALDGYGDIDAKTAKELRDQRDQAQREGLQKNGKFDELHKQDMERAEKGWKSQLEKSNQETERYKSRNEAISKNLVSAEIKAACAAAGVHASAVDDIVSRSSGKFGLDDDGAIKASEGNVDGKGNPLSVADWVDTLRENAPHLFDKPRGTGTKGSSTGAGQQQQSGLKRSAMSLDERHDYISAHGNDAYLKLPK